jgi:hypothetical protein
MIFTSILIEKEEKRVKKQKKLEKTNLQLGFKK